MTEPTTTTPETPVEDCDKLGVSYQKAAQVRQLLGERANAVAYLNTDRVTSIDVTLAMLGYTRDPTVGVDGDPTAAPPVGRSTRSPATVTTEAPTRSGRSTGSR